MFCFNSISRVYILNETKPPWISSIIVPWKVDVLERTELLKWPPKILLPAIMTKVANQKTGREISVTTSTISAPGARAPAPPSISTSWW
jgi:hypothetical protein